MSKIKVCVFISSLILAWSFVSAQTAMTNVFGRKCTSLNGEWNVIIDPTSVGVWRQVWLEKKAEKKTDFYEYSFEGGPRLIVPADFNSQRPELTFYEGTVWYKKTFTNQTANGKRLFLHFGAVNYLAEVYLNGHLIGSHEGGFTPFQFELTDILKAGENTIVVKVNNQRLSDGIPGLGYDWMNYGGITRDVNLIETPESFIEDYSIQLKKNSYHEVLGWVRLNKATAGSRVEVLIPELGLKQRLKTNESGLAELQFAAPFKLWSPQNPKLYKVILQTATDTIVDEIGFRCIATKNAQILLNGEPIFLKGINIHEENPFRGARACSEADALLLLTWAKELGCNFVRLAHYPHNEYMVKMAEKMGLLVWDEMPVYQHIEFSSPRVVDKMSLMLREMVARDRNRCAVFLWSIANETYTTTPNRDRVLIDMAKYCRQLDSTRLLTHVTCTQGYQNNLVDVWDTTYRYFDVMSVNEYIGWYVPWQGRPEETRWKLVCNDKPLIISELGGESLFGNNNVPGDEAAYWSETYQEQIYKDQITMFKNTANLSGVCPWLLVDYRSLGRMHPIYQNGWNRKGLLSEKGEKKKAWYILHDYYNRQ